MSTIGSWSPSTPRTVAHRRHVWLLRRLGRVLIATLSAAACSAPSAIGVCAQLTSDAEQPIRWWRDEARRGIAELEAFLAD